MSRSPSIPLIDHWIDGQFQSSSDTDRFESRNPINDSLLAQVALAGEPEIDQAVRAADQAFANYRQTPPTSREKWLLQAADLLEQRQESFLEILIDEIGSPVTKARREVATATNFLRASAGATRHLTGKTFPTDIPGRLSLSMRVPLGVVAAMTPFNVPLIKIIKHAAMPLATGNTVVLLPSEETPLLASLVAQLFSDAGFPAGTFNVVFGRGADIGDFLTTHPLVRFVGFTGSQRVGRHVQSLCGQHGKRVTLELGGKNPLVVLRDADFTKAIPGCLLGSFLYQGQICMSSSRIYIEQPIFREFSAALVQAAQQIGCGDLRDPQTMVGPIINLRQRERIRGHIEDAIDQGAQLLTGNTWQGNVLEPTILSDVKPSMKIFHEETFGPVTALQAVDSPEQAIEQANDSPFGLCGAIYTNQLDQALHYASALQAGMVHINATTIQEEPHVPFGGTKQSGFGREGTQVSVDELTEWKWVTFQ